MLLKSQLSVTFGLMLLLSVAVVIGFTYCGSQLMRYQQLALVSTNQHARLQRTEIAFTNELKAMSHYLLHGDEKFAVSLTDAAQHADQCVDELIAVAETEIKSLNREELNQGVASTLRIYATLRDDRAQVKRAFSEIVALHWAGRRVEATRRFQDLERVFYDHRLLTTIAAGVRAEADEVRVRKLHMAAWKQRLNGLALSAVLVTSVVVVTSLAVLFSSLRKIQKAETEREALQRDLVRAAHSAGMSDIATGVLHNVGNVLNSVNTSASSITALAKDSVMVSLADVLKLVSDHEDDFADFAAQDPRGKVLPKYFAKVVPAIEEERRRTQEEINRLQDKIVHVKHAIRIQQEYARSSVFKEPVTVSQLIRDAIALCDRTLHRHGIRLVERVEATETLMLAKSKLLQVLVNLIKNATEAILESETEPRLIAIGAKVEDKHLRISVRDTGTGISSENLQKIFIHGFTTKADGHGFGLHICAVTMQELEGSISVESEGLGCGTTFTLRLPYEPASHAPLRAASATM